MPADAWTDAVRMITAGTTVAVVVLPFAVLSWRSLRMCEPILPTWKPWRVPWSGFEVFLAFVVAGIAIPMAFAQLPLPPLARSLISLPLQLGFLAIAARQFYPAWNPLRPEPVQPSGNRAAGVVLAILAWAVLTPFVLSFHAVVLQLQAAIDGERGQHPLEQFRSEGIWDTVLFLAQAAFVAPLIEEILFRGILLPWIGGGRDRTPGNSIIPAVVPVGARPWLVVALSALYAASTGKLPPLAFAGVLAVGLVVVRVAVRRSKWRTAGAVYSSAAFFGVIHSAVWPSPIPLFVLGLGLGWLAMRTRGVLVPTIVHGLFNAVSAVYVLRGAAG